MATLNSLLFLFSTLAPNVDPPGNFPVTQVPSEWVKGSVPYYGQNVPVLTQMVCPIAEHLSCNSHCQKNCTNYGQDIPCPDICVLGCVCVEPFLRGSDGSCIMPNECPATPDTSVTTDSTDDEIQCQTDEEVSPFPHCERNCTNTGDMIFCPGEGPRGCVCKSPKIRGPEGNCIMPDECPRTLRSPQVPMLTQMVCPIAEHLSCNSHCQKNCSNYDQDIPCPDICVLGCVCVEPFLRGSDGSCIMPYECPASPATPVTTDSTVDEILCQTDEEVSPFPHCERNCTNAGEMIVCPGEGPRGCVCKSPKIRGPEGNCIMSEECPRTLRSPQDVDDDVDPDSSMTCPPNEEVSCFSHCQANCTNYDKSVHCPMYCVTGCVCTLPLIRGPDGSCIMPEQCNALKKTPQRSAAPSACFEEKLTGSCRSHLPRFYYNKETGNCESFIYGGCHGNSNNFNTQEECEAVCKVPESQCQDSEDCNDNDDENENVVLRGPFDHLLSCENTNEVYKLCPSLCPDHCENYKKTSRRCKFICSRPKCECKDGFVRGPNGDCIQPDQCFFPETSGEFCPENEEYKECGTACQKNCQNYDTDEPCTAVCESGCFCKEPMIRGPDGNCIYQEECSAKLSELNQVQPWYQPSNVRPVPWVPIFNAQTANPSSDEGCPENEEYQECGTACQKNCQNYDRNTPCEFKCEPGCFCKEPMIRGPSGKCIYKEDCPAKANDSRQPRKYFNMGFLKDLPTFQGKDWICKKNETFSLCAPLPMCHDDCTNYNEDRYCKRACMPGCKCIDGYVKGKEGTCIKIEECEENKDSDSSEESSDCSNLEVYQECGPYCETDCDNYNAVDRKCEDSRCRKGCFCKSGLVRSPEGKCIAPEDCPAPSTRSWSPKFLQRGMWGH